MGLVVIGSLDKWLNNLFIFIIFNNFPNASGGVSGGDETSQPFVAELFIDSILDVGMSQPTKGGVVGIGGPPVNGSFHNAPVDIQSYPPLEHLSRPSLEGWLKVLSLHVVVGLGQPVVVGDLSCCGNGDG